ncbi:hypothetical protein Bhyg_10904 [Pseudolycoriella hygida]|uniref:Uncharacterized protein n=1 Tax=Pseudolycoriella hygida TaxID=35572 RepID=A0A9Q0MUC0_9DIPT|nr:hypothetical protein Bhyg_10904 [Pseudolycoriella hygida]
MRDYPAVQNVFRINSSSSILLDDKHKISKNSEREHLTMNGDINYRHRNNSRNCDGPNGTACAFINIDGISENENFTLNSVRDDRLLSPVTKTSSDIVIQSQRKNNYALWIITPVAASFAVAVVIASLAGPQWLLTEEKLPNHNYNGTANFNAADDGIYITKHTKSSLWILCASQGLDYHCSTIDYFPNEEYSPDPNDSTMAIPCKY